MKSSKEVTRFKIQLALFTTYLSITTISGQEPPPRDPNADHIHFYYYPDASNSSIRKELNVSDPSTIENAELTRNTGAKFIVHGTQGTCKKTDFPIPAINAYLKSKQDGSTNYNIFCVEYTDFTVPGNTLVPRGNEAGGRYMANIVGTETAKLIKELQDKQFIVDLKSVHVIGHSLGAHVSSGIGQKVYQMTNWTQKVGRISGLDPGNPVGYREMDLDIMLDSCDADFVDVYHTDAGRIGQRAKQGQVDFYPDGGESQNSCQNLPNIIERVLETSLGVCSHLIVGKYWAISVNDKTLMACEATSWKEYQEKKKNGICDNPAIFGEGVLPSTHGRYYLDYPSITLI